MRALTIAAIAGLGLAAVTGAAVARPWNDPAGRVSFELPNGWTVNTENVPNVTYVIAGTANNECHVIAIPRDQLASAAARDIRRAGADDAQNGAEVWTQRANAIPSIFPNNSANVLSRSSDTSQFWPIQRAEIQAPERLVHAAMQVRPGMELLTFCQTYEGADTTDVYDSVIRSVTHPNDATWQAQAEQQQAERDAAGAAGQQPQQAEAPEGEEQQGERPRRQRGFSAEQGAQPM